MTLHEETFGVVDATDDAYVYSTTVLHWVQGTRQLVSISQGNPDPDVIDKVVLDKEDFLRIANELRGH